MFVNFMFISKCVSYNEILLTYHILRGIIYVAMNSKKQIVSHSSL